VKNYTPYDSNHHNYLRFEDIWLDKLWPEGGL